MDNTPEIKNEPVTAAEPAVKTKFCKHCGAKIPEDAVICMSCGRQVEELKKAQPETPNIVINNSNSSVNTNTNTNVNGMLPYGRMKNKWVSLLLCLFLGYVGAHKFYEGKIIMGIIYIFTVGLFGIGAIVDFFVILCKPNPYLVV